MGGFLCVVALGVAICVHLFTSASRHGLSVSLLTSQPPLGVASGSFLPAFGRSALYGVYPALERCLLVKLHPLWVSTL